MDFKTATDRVAGCISHAEIAEAAGVSVQTIRQARLDPSAPGHRPPPSHWMDVLAGLLRQRANELCAFADQLQNR
ncbi:MAG TPA: hypothetical protein VF092_14530 [Longimicrobium sp.]